MRANDTRRTGTHTTTTDPPPGLAGRHHRILVEGSAIAPDVLAARGVRSIAEGRELPAEYSWRQRRRAPGILFTAHRPNGQTSSIFRPDGPDPDRPGHRYEQPCRSRGGSGNVLDVHPFQRHLIDDVSVPVLYCEGIKKSDSVTTAAQREGIEVLPVAISGVWNFLSEGEPIADMYDVPVEGRPAFIAFDSDMRRKPGVMEAAERLAEHLLGRGADVYVVYLDDMPDGSKCGADDFLASESSAGGTLAGLLSLARPHRPGDLRRERLSRDERLRRSLRYLWRVHDEMPARTRAECSMRAAWRAYVAVAERRGALGEDGVLVEHLSSRTGAELAAVGHRTFARYTNALVEEGHMRRIERERSEDAAGYVLLIPDGVPDRAELAHDGEQGTATGQGNSFNDELPRGVPLLRVPVPELRWPYVATVREQDDSGRLREAYEYVSRPGKQRGEIVRYLTSRGDEATIAELMERFAGPKTRVRDFKRRRLAFLAGRIRQYDGRPLSVGPPVIEIEGDTVRLVGDWAEALDRHIRLGMERYAAEKQKADHLRQRAAYRRRHGKPESNPSEAGVEAVRRSHEKREAEMSKAAGNVDDLEGVPDGDPEIVEALRRALICWPDHAGDFASWWASTLRAYGYVKGKPDVAAVEAALYELRREGAA